MSHSSRVYRRLYRAADVRELDRAAIEDHGIDSWDLMSRAGRAAFQALRVHAPEARTVAVAGGGGNNGGDGYVVARHALDAGLDVVALALSDPEGLEGDAARAAKAYREAGGRIEAAEAGDLPEPDAWVDAMLGTGLDREVRDDYAAVIDAINAAGGFVLAVDVPSGLNADTGAVLGTAVRADVTVTFIGRKRGLETAMGPDHAGRILFETLDVPETVHEAVDDSVERLSRDLLPRCLTPRRPSTHKGDLGHVLVCGGDHGMPGAVALAARAALETGAGLVSVATRPAHAPALAGSLPEAMWSDGEDGETLDALLDRADVVALGPGLGRSEWSRTVWKRLLDSDRPVVLDADGLNLLAESPRSRGNWILTPHPGEAARLLDAAPADVQADRFAAVAELARRYDAVVVLKGPGSLVCAPTGRTALSPYGNPAMATAGMGDALTGILAALLAQGLDAWHAAAAGTVLHGSAGDRAAAGRRQILASGLIAAIQRVLP
ncbi:MAG: NAD(P)H-hydrate dehydratase [Wenzhouxiangellaceae bacterium]|nr:NAD(P)H-hydrate dehydratase [Wenzhouxiangellaceae bacterium]